MTAAVVLTAMFGDYDSPPPVPAEQTLQVEWHYYTDSDVEAPEPWRTHRVSPLYRSANLSAKVFKCCPPFSGDVVWIDTNTAVMSMFFVAEVLDSRHDGVAAFAHPRRDCIYDEADASVGAESQGGKYDGFDLAGQVASYRAEGYPSHNGLFACGTMAYDLDEVRIRKLGTAWLSECVRWSPQDQLSFPVVCRRLGIEPGVFVYPQIDRALSRNHPYLANHWERILPHGVRV